MGTYVTFYGKVIRTTDAAVLVAPQRNDGVETLFGEQWFPRKVVLDGENVEEGDEDLEIAKWFIRKHGIEVP